MKASDQAVCKLHRERDREREVEAKKMERRAWVRGVWEIVKDAVSQKLLTCHLPPSLLLTNQLTGLSIVVTGATNGIGLHTARELAMAGAHVIMACRNTKAANEIALGWQKETLNSKALNVEVMALDLLSLASVRSFAAEWERQQRPLHVLVNNAGVLLLGEQQTYSSDGIEQHLQVNHVAPALLTLLLLPSLLRAPLSRVINVNSVAHHCAVLDPRHWNARMEPSKFNSLISYGASKLAHLMFLKALAGKLLEMAGSCIHCVAVHPGVVTTNLIPDFRGRKSFWTFDPAEGARSVIFCASSGRVVDNLVNGFAYYSSNCKPSTVSRQASDTHSCLEVLQKTIEILDLNPTYLDQLLNESRKMS